MNYTFFPAPNCNMCGSERQRIMGRRLNTAQGLRPKNKVGISTTVVRCRDCGLIYANPLPVPRSMEDHYGVPPENYWKPEYFSVPPHHFREEMKAIKSLTKGRKFLDIGAGVGKTMLACLDHGFDVYGLEGSKPFYERAAERLGERVTHSTFEDADYPKESFDVISFGVVLEHLYDPSGALKKALTWLKPGGVIHIEVPDAAYLYSKIFNLYFRLCRSDFVVNISPMHVPFHIYEFTERSFRLNGAELGYEIARLDRYAGGPPMGVAKPVHPLLKPVMSATNTGVGLVLYLRPAIS